MNKRLVRAFAAVLLTLTAGTTGYAVANTNAPTQAISAPAPGSVRVLYSLDKKQNDEEVIALIRNAKEYIHFAIFTFTLPSIADALVEAKERGVTVKGIIDSEQSKSSYGAPITEKLLAAGIPILTEQHASGNGIMHIKLLVTEQAYAFGSYNWTSSATTLNDEILEIGTSPDLRDAYENILKRLFNAYGNTSAANTATATSIGTIEYTEAAKYIGKYASVRGTLVKAYTSASGTVFLDFCKEYKNCPFSGVIFADDVQKFGDLSRYAGKTIVLSGKISSYQGKAEIVLTSKSQLSQ